MKEIEFFKNRISEEGLELIKKVLTDGESRVHELLEDEVSQTIGTKHAISVNNTTSAMHLGLCALDLKRGDKIICSINANPLIPETIRHFDAEPIFVDINEDDFCMSAQRCEEALEANMTKKLKAVIVSHVAGQSADMEPFYKLKERFGVKIIEDATVAYGGEYKGKKIGSLESDLSIFGFFPEAFGSIANGGVITTNSDEIAQRARLLRYHGLVHDKETHHNATLGYIYDVIDLGCRYDISQLEAAYCLDAANRNGEIIKKQCKIADIYLEGLKDTPHITLPKMLREHIFSLFIIKVDKNRDGFAIELQNRGIETSLHYIPLHLLSYYKNKYMLKVNHFPASLKCYQQILSLPIYPRMDEDEARSIVSMVKEVAKHRV